MVGVVCAAPFVGMNKNFTVPVCCALMAPVPVILARLISESVCIWKSPLLGTPLTSVIAMFTLSESIASVGCPLKIFKVPAKASLVKVNCWLNWTVTDAQTELDELSTISCIVACAAESS